MRRQEDLRDRTHFLFWGQSIKESLAWVCEATQHKKEIDPLVGNLVRLQYMSRCVCDRLAHQFSTRPFLQWIEFFTYSKRILVFEDLTVLFVGRLWIVLDLPVRHSPALSRGRFRLPRHYGVFHA